MTLTESGPRRSRLEAIIRFLVWSTVVCLIGVPLLLTVMVSLEIVSAFPFWRGNDGFKQTYDTLFDQQSKPSKPKIVTNVLAKERAKQIERLTALTGRPEMASGAATAVQFIAVAFEDIKPDAAESDNLPRQRVDEDGYRRLTLTMEQVQREAIVLVSEQPIRWTITGLHARSWPRIGFEGYAAFDVADGQPGSLAGFRIGMFGASEVVRAADPTRGEVSIRHTFCSSMQRWVDHFGTQFNASGFTLLLNPTAVTPRPGVPVSDGEIAKTMFGDEIERLCKPRSANQR